MSIQFQQLKAKLKHMLIELNIFKHHGSNEKQVFYQRIGTRLYILILIISVIILTFDSLLFTEIHRETVRNPTLSEYNRLQQLYPDLNSLSCPCTSISMNYSTFIHIEPQYHQVCSSDLLSTQWMDYISNVDPAVIYRVDDYRSEGITQFSLLSMFYQKANKTIDTALQVFLQSQLVSSQVISQQLFESQVNFSIHNWESSTKQRFIRTIELVRAMHFGNHLFSDSARDYFGMNDATTAEAQQRSTKCICYLSSSCRYPMNIYDTSVISYNTTILFPIPNFYIGCFPIEGLFQSTLECFYNISCMLGIDQYMYMPLGTSFNFSSLDPNRNWPHETIESIINRLMVDSWNSNISFPSYYNTCAPSSCTYEYIGRQNIFFVVMTIIGIFGGLSLGLKLSILIILRCMEKLMNNFSRVGFKRIIKNVFICRTEPQTINRLHFILLVVILCIIYSFSTSTSQSTTVQIIKPSLSTYENLVKQFPNSLQCSCSNISMKYQTFLISIPRFHQLCSSEFVSNDWIQYLFDDAHYINQYPLTDFGVSAPGQFQLLASLCQLSQQTINDSLSQLMTSDFVNSQLLSSNLLNEQLQTVINHFQFTIPSVFVDTINLIRHITGDNMIMSIFYSNWRFIADTVLHAD